MLLNCDRWQGQGQDQAPTGSASGPAEPACGSSEAPPTEPAGGGSGAEKEAAPTVLDSDESAPFTPTAIVSDESAPLTPTVIRGDESAPLTPTAINSDQSAQGQGDSLLELWDRGPLPVESNLSSPDSQDTVIEHQREMTKEAIRRAKRWREEEEHRAELLVELRARQTLAVEEVSRQYCSALEAGVVLADTALDETHAIRNGPSRSELELAKSIARNSQEFYVGGCRGIARRFLGDMEFDRPMTGHRRDGWPCMTVFATCEGPAGPRTELRCIKKLRREFNWGPRLNEGPCKNKCEDARGLSGCSGVVNFIYICHR